MFDRFYPLPPLLRPAILVLNPYRGRSMVMSWGARGQSVAEHVLRRRIPSFSYHLRSKWFSGRSVAGRSRALSEPLDRAAVSEGLAVSGVPCRCLRALAAPGSVVCDELRGMDQGYLPLLDRPCASWPRQGRQAFPARSVSGRGPKSVSSPVGGRIARAKGCSIPSSAFPIRRHCCCVSNPFFAVISFPTRYSLITVAINLRFFVVLKPAGSVMQRMTESYQCY